MCKRKVSVRRYRAHGGNWADSRSYAMVQIMKVWTDEVLMKLDLSKGSRAGTLLRVYYRDQRS